jgi:4-amino-4-deoxy-L-arabinose transferase-like glycosyltransferase
MNVSDIETATTAVDYGWTMLAAIMIAAALLAMTGLALRELRAGALFNLILAGIVLVISIIMHSVANDDLGFVQARIGIAAGIILALVSGALLTPALDALEDKISQRAFLTAVMVTPLLVLAVGGAVLTVANMNIGALESSRAAAFQKEANETYNLTLDDKTKYPFKHDTNVALEKVINLPVNGQVHVVTVKKENGKITILEQDGKELARS